VGVKAPRRPSVVAVSRLMRRPKVGPPFAGDPQCLASAPPGDLGVMEEGQWKDLFDLGFDEGQQLPWQERKLVNPNRELLRKTSLECVRGITVNEINTQKPAIKLVRDKYMPVVESMEGAAFHYVCLMEKIPFLQLRGISNYVGERNKANWKIRESVDALNSQLIILINQITDPY